MRASRPKHRAWALAGAFLTLLTMGLLAPASARGECRHPGDRPAIGIDAAQANDPAPVPAPKPCSGPQCSGKSGLPPTTVPQPPPRSELWAIAIEPEPIDPPGRDSIRPESLLARPIRLATSIFHPPRLPR